MPIPSGELAETLIPELPQAAAWLAQSPVAPLLTVNGRQPLAVAWSGGIDSTALLLALQQTGYCVQAWHIDHGWNAQSASWQRTLRHQAALWGIPYRHRRLSLPTDKNREAIARQGRYRALAELAQDEGIDTLCLAHHADDQAETVCMRLLQGSGIQGCCGMSPQRSMLGMQILRPFLHLAKCELRQALQQAHIPVLNDPSNHDTALWRNYIRHHLFPAIQHQGYDPAELFLRWQHQALRLNRTIQELADPIAITVEQNDCHVPWSQWTQQTQPVRVAVLQRMMVALRGEGQVFGRRHLQLIDQWRAQGGRNGLDLNRCRLSHCGSRLLLHRC